MARGRVIVDLSPDEAEFIADCISQAAPRDAAGPEWQRMADEARAEVGGWDE